MLRRIIAFVLAAALMVVAGSASHSYFVQRAWSGAAAMAGGEVPAMGAWLIGNSTPIRLNKFAMGESFTSCSAGRSSGRWPVRRAASAVLRPWCA